MEVDLLAELIAKKIAIQQTYPRWLKLKFAAQYSAIGQNRLKELAINGEIKGFQDNTDRADWIFDKLSLDAYRESQVSKTNQKAIDILKSL